MHYLCVEIRVFAFSTNFLLWDHTYYPFARLLFLELTWLRSSSGLVLGICDSICTVSVCWAKYFTFSFPLRKTQASISWPSIFGIGIRISDLEITVAAGTICAVKEIYYMKFFRRSVLYSHVSCYLKSLL